MSKDKTVLHQLEDWIEKFEKVNGTPTMCEIKAQIEMFKELEKQQTVNIKSEVFSHAVGISEKDSRIRAEIWFNNKYGNNG